MAGEDESLLESTRRDFRQETTASYGGRVRRRHIVRHRQLLCCISMGASATIAAILVLLSSTLPTPPTRPMLPPIGSKMLDRELTYHHNLYSGDASRSWLGDKTVNPCEDFYEATCGGFRVQALPDDHQEWYYAFDGVRERIALRMFDLLHRNPKSELSKLYQSCMDQSEIEKVGMKPLRDYLNIANEATRSKTGLVRSVAELHKINAKPFFEWSVGADDHSETQIFYLEQGGLTLPNREWYIEKGSRFKVHALSDLIKEVMMFIGKSDIEAEEAAFSIVFIETKLATAHVSADARDAAEPTELISFQEVVKGMKDPHGFNWELFFMLLGVSPLDTMNGKKLVRVNDIPYFEKLNKMFSELEPRHFKWYILWRFLDTLIAHLGKKFQDADFVFRKGLYGIEADPPRWRVCLHTLKTFLPGIVGKLYRYDSLQHGLKREEQAQALLYLLREEYAAIITKATWISSESRRKAIDKLWQMDFEIGGPDKPEPLGFKVQNSWFNNSVSIAKRIVKSQLVKLGQQLERDDWGSNLGAMSVAAYYNVHTNSLFLPAALLQQPFMSVELKADGLNARDFGSLGGLAAHEMTHGFDHVGRLYGPDQVSQNWWDDKTKLNYKERAQCVANYYHTFKDMFQYVSGNQTISEDMADIAGLHISYEAMMSHARKLVQSKDTPKGYKVTREERKEFFRSWAETWCHMGTDKAKEQMLQSDPHSPPSVRVNAALSQFKPFQETYNCPRGSPMNPDTASCALW